MKRLALLAMAAMLTPLLPLAAQQEKTERIGNGVSSPKVIHKVDPGYTDEARDAKINGTVTLSVEISRDGVADVINVIKSLDRGLDQNAVEAVRQWRFKPAEKDGTPVRVSATIEVNFRLE